MSEDRVNAITCTTWVPKGVAKQNPEKIEITKEELVKIIKETSENLVDLEVEENDYTELEVEALEEDLKIDSKRGRKSQSKKESNDVEMRDCNEKNDNEKENTEIDYDKNEDFENRYNFKQYDTETDDGLENLLKLGRLTVHADDADDPHLTINDNDDDNSEVENNKIYLTDNLITVGHVDGDAAILEVYVYNDVEGSMYVHHDILLPSVPLCMEWLNYDPEEENLKPGNMVAIGSMSPIIEVWDLDLIDCLEPAYKLGRKPKKKKKITRIGHSDSVLCLGWNRELDHILASGSVDKTVILWDLQQCQEAQKFTQFGDKVQDLKWHSKENHYLLAGSSDKTVKLFDCLSENNCKSWMLDGEVECVVWDPCSSHNFNFFAATDVGSVYSIDSRQEKPLQKINAHEKCCTGIVMNSKLPGCLVTVSEDKTVKIWDVLQEPKAKLIEEKNVDIGIIHTVSCSPESPFVLSLGGDNKMNNFKVWDIRNSKNVRRGFVDRLNLPINDVNEEGEDEAVAKSDSEMEDALDDISKSGLARQPSKWKPSKKSKKKKGGHLDKKKQR